MKVYGCIFFLLYVVSFSTVAHNIHPAELVRFTEEANKAEKWNLGTTNRWDTFEQFFLTRGQKAYYRCGYLYDLKNEKILSGEKTIAIAPDLADVVTMKSDDIDVSTKELEEFLNIGLPSITQHHYVYLYFDIPVRENGDYEFSDNPDFREHLVKAKTHREKAARVLSAHQDIPKYRIAIPLTGFKSQKF